MKRQGPGRGRGEPENYPRRATQAAETARIRYKYRKLVVMAKSAPIPIPEAIRLVGPDCAYHLYRMRKRGVSAGAR
jgi:hypothetical protein